MRMTDLFIRRPVLATSLSLLILVLGLRAIGMLPVREFPKTENAVINVTTYYTGALQRPDGASRHTDPQHRLPTQGAERHLHRSGKPHAAANHRLRPDRDRPHACPVSGKIRSRSSPINTGNLLSNQ